MFVGHRTYWKFNFKNMDMLSRKIHLFIGKQNIEYNFMYPRCECPINVNAIFHSVGWQWDLEKWRDITGHTDVCGGDDSWVHARCLTLQYSPVLCIPRPGLLVRGLTESCSFQKIPQVQTQDTSLSMQSIFSNLFSTSGF